MAKLNAKLICCYDVDDNVYQLNRFNKNASQRKQSERNNFLLDMHTPAAPAQLIYNIRVNFDSNSWFSNSTVFLFGLKIACSRVTLSQFKQFAAIDINNTLYTKLKHSFVAKWRPNLWVYRLWSAITRLVRATSVVSIIFLNFIRQRRQSTKMRNIFSVIWIVHVVEMPWHSFLSLNISLFQSHTLSRVLSFSHFSFVRTNV